MNRVPATAATAVRLHFSFVRFFTCTASACLFLACGLAHAQVTPIDWYRMGDSDGTTVAGQPLTATIDIVGGKTLALTGALVQTDIGATAVSSVGSTRSLLFTGASGDAGNAPLLSTITDNFGLEAWVKPLGTSATDQVIAYNGNFGFNGWGIVLKSDGTYQGQFGIVPIGSVPATIGTWAHVAIVRDNGNATLYVNGVASGGSTTLPPSTPSTRFGVANGLPASATGLHGLVDEVRVFTFPGGFFDPNMLLFSAKRVTSNANAGAGSLRDQMIAVSAGGTVVISATGTIALDGPLAILNRGVNLFGPGAANLSLSGASANPTRVFFVDSPSPVMIADLTIANGLAKGGAGGIATWGGGGGMGAGGGVFVNSGNVVLTRVNFTGNAATGGKGGNSSGSSCQCMGGGGGLGGAGGSPTAQESAGGGGGWLSAGGGSTKPFGAGGGGGVIGQGGGGGDQTGGGGGAYTNGQDGVSSTVGGNGADGLGGHGGSYSSTQGGPANGGNGLNYGGGGGAAINGNGGSGGSYAGGGGATVGLGGAGGDFGGSGGGSLGPIPLPGGFGGGSGGASQNAAGNGGFGGGSGGSEFTGGSDALPGAFAGRGAANAATGGGGGGGAALGGAIFVRADNSASLTWNDGSADAGTLTAGAPGNTGGAGAGSTAGSTLFLLGGTTTLNVSAGQQTILGSIGGWSNEPPNIAKIGTGTLVLAGGGTNLGVITASKGDLRVNFNPLNLVAGKELDVNNGGTLSGVMGTINGPVKLASGGTISPGDPSNAFGIGNLGVGDLTWNGGGVVAFQLASTNDIASDLLTVTGNLTRQGSGFAFHITDGFDAPICGTTYTLIQYTGTTTFAAADFAFTYSGASALAASSVFAIDTGARKVLLTAHCSNDQTITNFVATPANPVYSNGGTFSITATPGGSSAALRFASNTPAICSLSGSIVTMHAHGICQLTADQAGDSLYNPAPTATLTLHFEQFTVNAATSSAFGSIGPSPQVVDYNATASFTVVPQSGFTAIVSGDTCTITHTSASTWTSGPITSDCNVTADFIDRVFSNGFE